jgi:hypothetical protein
MPYKVKGKCVYKKDTNKKVGCTDGSVKDYMSALHANVDTKKESFDNLVDSMLTKYLFEDIMGTTINNQTTQMTPEEKKAADAIKIAKQAKLKKLQQIANKPVTSNDVNKGIGV